MANPPDPPGHAECAEFVKLYMAARGVEVNVSDRDPWMVMPKDFDDLNMRCPHGVSMFMEPTVEQRLSWIETRTP